MELKTARLTLLIDPNKKAAFERLCEQQDLTPSQVVRQMIRQYLIEHGVTYAPSGAGEDLAAGKLPAVAARKPGTHRRGAARTGAPERAPAKASRARRRG